MDLTRLEEQINREKKIKDHDTQEVKSLEKRAADVRNEISIARKQGPEHGGTDSDGYKQLQDQVQANAKLEKNIALERERLKILSERNADITEMDLDLLSQTELIRLVKQLERIRTDYQSNLREIQVSLDQQAQEYQRLNEVKNLYQAELGLRDRKRRQTIANPLGTART